MIDDVLQCVLLSLSLPRLVQVKLVDRQWRRVARRVLTSDEWLYMGVSVEIPLTVCDEIQWFAERPLLNDRLSMKNPYHNLRSMQYAVEYQWNVLQLPCRIELSLEHGRTDGEWEVGILEDLTVDNDMCIRSIVVTIRDSIRFFAPHHFRDEYWPEGTFDSDNELSWWILDGIFPLVPGSARHWMYPNRATLDYHLRDKSRPVRRSTGEDVRV